MPLGKIYLQLVTGNVGEPVYQIECEGNWTISDLRHIAETKYPCARSLYNIRYMNNGELLPPDTPLSDIYEIRDEPHIELINEKGPYTPSYPDPPPNFTEAGWTPERVAGYYREFSSQASSHYRDEMERLCL